jgi:GAF domain-containing protein
MSVAWKDKSVPTDEHAYYRALYRVACLVNSSLDLRETLSAVVQSVAEAMNARASSIRLLDESGNQLALVSSFGLSDRYLNKGSIDVAASKIDREALLGATVAVGNVATDTRLQYPDELAREGITSVLCAPLVRHGHPIGVMRVYTGEERMFGTDEVEFLQALSDICALAIENARMFDALNRTYHDTVESFWGSSGR